MSHPLEELYASHQPEEITKEQYVEGVLDIIAHVEGMTDFIMNFDLQGTGEDLPGILGGYTDFLDKYESTNTKDEGYLYREWGTELYGILCTSVFQLSTGETVQVGSLEYIDKSFTPSYLDALYNLNTAMHNNVKCLNAGVLEDYRYFMNADGVPYAIPAEQVQEPEVDNSEGMFI